MLNKITCALLFNILLYTPVYSDNILNKQEFIISSGGELILCSFADGTLKKQCDLIEDRQWSDNYWPSYDKRRGIVYFETQNKVFGWHPQIAYIKNPNTKQNIPVRLIEGMQPCISPNGNILSFYVHPNQLWIVEIESMIKRKIVSDIAGYLPAIWISDQQLLYSDKNNHMIKYDINTGTLINTGYIKVVPGSLSPDGRKVLCGDGSKIYLYTIGDNTLHCLTSSMFFSFSDSFVWFQDSDSFLYARQIFSNQIRFDETHSLFKYSLSNKKSEILFDKFSLGGGVPLISQE